MDRLKKVVSWNSVTSEGWSFRREEKNVCILAFELPKTADFSSARFQYLGDMNTRKQEVAQRQKQMLQQLHGLGLGTAFSLRIVREESRMRFLVLVRFADQNPVPSSVISDRIQRVEAAFPREYSLVQVPPSQYSDAVRRALDVSWSGFVQSVLRPETVHSANPGTWPFYYVPMLFEGRLLNDMKSLCHTLLRFTGQALVDITLVPMTPSPEERDWVTSCLQRMREALGGERVYSRDGKEVLRRYDPMPGLRVPVENLENLLKRYDQLPLFVYAFRVFADRDPSSLTRALVAGATRSNPEILTFTREDWQLGAAIDSANSVDITPEIHKAWWDELHEHPLRAQRLQHLADIEEVASFWRLPIPVHEQFPGVEIDRGLDSEVVLKEDAGIPMIVLGTSANDAGQATLPAAFDRQELVKHGLVVGAPGSGKTTLLFNLLHQLWQPAEHRVPFMVLEPAKTEYRALKRVPLFQSDLLVFTLGDERVCPFRFNPFHVLDGITLESHIARLNACFVAAFDLFDPLPMLLDQAIRDIYHENGWTELAVGGDKGCARTPTLADLHCKGREVADNADYAGDVKSNIRAALDLRLASLLRGSKGYMLNTAESLPASQLVGQPVILELDSLNQDEKALMMMLILTFIYEHAKSTRSSGSPLSHVLVIEEAHNLIGRAPGPTSQYRANPKAYAIDLFVRILAEMRALGQGILIADQLSTALAPEAMKNTNLKVLMRLTAMDDRLEIGNTMGLTQDAPEIEGAVHLRSGSAYAFLESWDRVRLVRTPDYKREHGVDQPQSDSELHKEFLHFEQSNPKLYMPFDECVMGCQRCNRETRSTARWFVQNLRKTSRMSLLPDNMREPVCEHLRHRANAEAIRRAVEGQSANNIYSFCLLLHLWHEARDLFPECPMRNCRCEKRLREDVIELSIADGHSLKRTET